MRPLGRTQQDLVKAMGRHGNVWHRGCGWVWTSEQSTEQMMQALARRGVVSAANFKTSSGRAVTLYTLKEIA